MRASKSFWTLAVPPLAMALSLAAPASVAVAVPTETVDAVDGTPAQRAARHGTPLERAGVVRRPTPSDTSNTSARSATSVVRPPEPPVVVPTRTERPPSTLPADCSRDVSAELNAWLSGLPASDVRVVFPQNGCYRTERAVTVSAKNGWELDGRGTELRRTQPTPAELRYPKNNRHLAVVDSSDVIIRNFRVTGLNTTSDLPRKPHFGRYVRELEFEHAYSAWNSSRLRFQDLFADGPFGDGLYLHANVHDVEVRRVDLARNGRQGIAALGSRVLIDYANLRSSRRSGIDLEPDAESLSDVEIRNSTIRSHLLAIASGGPGNVDRIYVHHNTIKKTGTPWLYAARDGFTRNDWTVTDNWVQPFLSSPVAAMRFQNADRVRVERNVVPVATGQSRLIFDVASSSVTAVCNSFRGAGTITRDLDGKSRVTLIANETGAQPPACLDKNAVGAPREPEPVKTTNDWYSAATAVPALAVGASSPTYPVDNSTYAYEEFEPATARKSGRSAWYRYRTGPAAETVTVRTTGALRSIKVITGDDLYWHTPVLEHYHTPALRVQLAPSTSYSIQLDDTTAYTGADVARSVTFTRDR